MEQGLTYEEQKLYYDRIGISKYISADITIIIPYTKKRKHRNKFEQVKSLYCSKLRSNSKYQSWTFLHNNERILIININIYVECYIYIDDNLVRNKVIGHTNTIIIDTYRKIILRFEPFVGFVGFVGFFGFVDQNNIIDSVIYRELSSVYRNYEYISSVPFRTIQDSDENIVISKNSSYISVQNIEQSMARSKNCSYWCLLFQERIINNLNQNIQNIQNIEDICLELINTDQKSLTNLIELYKTRVIEILL